MDTIYIVDTKIYAYNQIQRNLPITGIFDSIAGDLLYLKKKGRVYLTFDVGHSSFREEEQNYYKGKRREEKAKKSLVDQEAHKQFNADYLKLIPIFKCLNVIPVAVEGVEADDLVSLIALRYAKDSITILTADRDHLHSVVGTENVRMFSGREDKFFYHADVEEKYGTESRREFTLLKCILGDEGDTLKSFRNVGVVKSAQIFNEIKSIYGEPTNAQVIAYLENYLEENKKVKIHEYHIDAGRTTVEAMFNSNLKVAATFEDFKYMTREQLGKYLKDMDTKPSPSKEEFERKSIELFGFPIYLSENAVKVLL